MFKQGTVVAIFLLFSIFSSLSRAGDWYVSQSTGKGKKASKEAPAKDLGNIISKLQPGDVVHIAEGIYLGRGKNGSNTINVPISIIAGYDTTFSKRDPWGAHQTIFSGDNLSPNYTALPALFIDLMKFKGPASPITVDGLIIDGAGRNHYASQDQHKLLAKANPTTGQNPSPSLGGLVISVQKSGQFDDGPRWQIVVRNNIVMNTFQNQAALAVSGFKGSQITIENNLVIQHSGSGIYCGSKFAGNDQYPEFKLINNTVLFSWDSGMSQGFNIALDRFSRVELRHNVLGFADIIALHNASKSQNVLLVGNLITGARVADYLEFDTQMDVENMLDEAELPHEDSDENITDAIKVPVSRAFAELYGSRVIVDREKAEAGVSASNSDANALRSMLGLPLQAGSVKWPQTPVYLNRISIEDALAAGSAKYKGQYGCSKPAAQ